MNARIPFYLVRIAARNAARFYVMGGGRVMIGATSSGDLLAWHDQ